MTKPTSLAIDLLRIDGGTQSRLTINEDVVADYADTITSNGKEWPFPPVDVFHDGTDYFVADGFHRVLAGQRSKRGSIPSIVHKGTARDARIFGMTANDRHGLRMSRADKRACVVWLLDSGEKMTQTEIAEAAGVTPRYVRTIVLDRKPKPDPSPPKGTGTSSGSSGGGGQSDEVEHAAPDTPVEPEEFVEKPDKKRSTQPPKQFDRSYWFRQWEQAIGPVVRLVDNIAEGVGERGDPHQEAIQDRLNEATEEMMEWMKVKP